VKNEKFTAGLSNPSLINWYEPQGSASAEQLQRSRKLRGIKPYLPVHRPRVAEALAEAQAEREGGIKT